MENPKSDKGSHQTTYFFFQLFIKFRSAYNHFPTFLSNTPLEVGRVLLFTMNFPKLSWGDVVLTAAYLVTRTPPRVLEFKSPIDLLSQSFHKITLIFGYYDFKL